AVFLISIKAHSCMTHTRTAGEAEFRQFREALTPLVAERKLGAVLAQFPWSFKPTEEAADWLRILAQELYGLPVVVEFRNRAWIQEAAFNLLRELRLGFCCVDQPRLPGLIPPVARATSSIAYIRFHGRNADKWWQHNEAWERYDYLYAREELQPWVDKVRDLARKTDQVFAYFNNHYQAQAVQNAQMFQQMLIDAGLQ
ncbi:MAG: DUF72 domain-containing protein, partial [Armatimonadetes bacterium]|nr:DUF72 domain-containing protein [Armatimonadota bacterium]